MQVDPIKPKLKPPRTKHLTLNCDILLSNSAFKFNLRRYNKPKRGGALRFAELLAGAHTRPLFGST